MSNGGPAFPCEIDEKYYCMGNKTRKVSVTGLTKLEWFAGMALIATYMNGFSGPSDPERAEVCFDMAEAMLAESERRNAKR